METVKREPDGSLFLRKIRVKMELSVVMDIIDKVREPLKGMSAESNRYTQEIERIQAAQQDTTAALGMIDVYRQLRGSMDKSAMAMATAEEKLALLEDKAAKASQPNAALAAQIAEQEAQVKALAGAEASLSRLRAQSAANNQADPALATELARQETLVAKLSGAEARLAELREKAGATQPSAALIEQLAKQREKVEKLGASHDEYAGKLKTLGTKLKASGVSVDHLDDGFSQLTKSQDEHQAALTRTVDDYQKLRRVMQPIQKLSQSISMPTMENAQGMAMGGVASIGAVAGLGMVLSDTAEQINILSRAAADVNMPVDALQALRLQAQGAGAESEDMDAALKEMTLRWGEMKSLKSGAMNDYFKDTGNRAAYEDLMKAGSALEAYQVLVREISAETDSAKKNFMADEFFGGDSEKMLAVLGGGVEGFNAAKQQLQDTGGPISEESVSSAAAFSSTMKTMKAILESLKISALTPLMKEFSLIMGGLAEKMKNLTWRNEMIAQIKTGVMAAFQAIRAFGSALMFLGEHFKEIMAVLALAKLGFLALNAVMMANPLGLLVAGIGAAVVAITYLIDKFIGFDKVMAFIRTGIAAVKANFLGMIEMLPKSLIPDSWQDSIAKMQAETAAIRDGAQQPANGEMAAVQESIRDIRVKAGLDDDMLSATLPVAAADNPPSALSPAPLASNYTPLGTQSVKSQSEVSLTIKSDKPVQVDRADSDRHTDLNLNLGDMSMAY